MNWDTIITELFHFDIKGLGWKVIISALFLLGVLWIWYTEKRFSYKDIIIRKSSKEEYEKFNEKEKSTLFYDDNSEGVDTFYWIFGSHDKQLNVKLYKYNATTDSTIETNLRKRLKKNYTPIIFKPYKMIQLEPDTFCVFKLRTIGIIPCYQVKLEMDGRISYFSISSNMRFGNQGDQINKLKFKQTFIGFLKSIFTGKIK
ncbi:hypothetical protein [Brochothrix thermosphacta]|uniref:hypothetical protein n=1 Tax=Brochothrix thermosphacta TaxID=2756 RepID=UPI00048F7B1D|nr:hypothetical protein [Brochothrix thermosphacta]ODJ51545.1 hypothetical protein BFR34_00560 [Brochothrix thermosphacta DSM 20171 = FSL F6-1036]